MPGLNQRGPTGQGPMTGRRMGKCTNFGANQRVQTVTDELQEQDFNTKMEGRGFARGLRGRGAGGCGSGRRMGMQNRSKRNS